MKGQNQKTIGVIGAGRVVRPITDSVIKKIELISDAIPTDIQGDKRAVMIAKELKQDRAAKFIQACNQASQPGGPEDFEASLE